ncbi:MAG: hypothetical protein GY906_11185 [bacterium]|nr:hypothetical protein [bacterium]
MDDFLKLEYEQCINLLLRYDDRQLNLARFATLLSCAVASAMIALAPGEGNASNMPWAFMALLSALTSLGLAVVFCGMVQNRLYFVFPARQVNSIRRHELHRRPDDSFENKMYVNTAFSAFHPMSTHTIMSVFVAIQIGVFGGLFHFCISMARTGGQQPLLSSILIGLIAAVVLALAASLYLHLMSNKTPDHAVHAAEQ